MKMWKPVIRRAQTSLFPTVVCICEPDPYARLLVAGMLDYLDTLYEHHFDVPAEPAERNRALNALFREHELTLLEPLLDFLRSHDRVRIVGPQTTTERAPIVSILPKGMNLHQVYESLTKHKLMLGYGDFYAVRPLMDMGIPTDPGVIRMSYLHYTSKEEIEQLISGLSEALG